MKCRSILSTATALLLPLVSLSGCAGAEILGASALLITVGLIVYVALIIFAVIDILGNGTAIVPKLLWIALIVFAPFIGAVLYLLIGKR